MQLPETSRLPTAQLIPEMPGVTEAYLGFLPASEFLALLRDESGVLLKTIFYDKRSGLAGLQCREQRDSPNLGCSSSAQTFRAP